MTSAAAQATTQTGRRATEPNATTSSTGPAAGRARGLSTAAGAVSAPGRERDTEIGDDHRHPAEPPDESPPGRRQVTVGEEQEQEAAHQPDRRHPVPLPKRGHHVRGRKGAGVDQQGVPHVVVAHGPQPPARARCPGAASRRVARMAPEDQQPDQREDEDDGRERGIRPGAESSQPTPGSGRHRLLGERDQEPDRDHGGQQEDGAHAARRRVESGSGSSGAPQPQRDVAGWTVSRTTPAGRRPTASRSTSWRSRAVKSPGSAPRRTAAGRTSGPRRPGCAPARAGRAPPPPASTPPPPGPRSVSGPSTSCSTSTEPR